MANRRMFSKRIISSARFLKLTKDAQILYFHLCMNADDDGAVEGFPVRRSIGIEEDAYANLEGRGFVTVLDRDNEVLYINDWHEHNKIRADRLQTSMYRDLIESKVRDVVLIEPKTRSDIKGKTSVPAGQDDDGQSVDEQWTDRGLSVDGPLSGHGHEMDGLGKDRLGKVRLSQDRLEEDREEKVADAPKKRKRFVPPSLEEVESYIREKGLSTDPQYFIDYNTARGWKLKGGQAMKDWKATLRTWERNHKEWLQQRQASLPVSKAQIVTRDEEQPEWGGIFDE